MESYYLSKGGLFVAAMIDCVHSSDRNSMVYPRDPTNYKCLNHCFFSLRIGVFDALGDVFAIDSEIGIHVRHHEMDELFDATGQFLIGNILTWS